MAARKSASKNKNKNKKVRVALVQMACIDKPDQNVKKALERIGKAAKAGAQIVCLQELFRSRYFCQSEDDAQFELAESIPGPTSKALAKAAAQHKIALVGSIFERRAQGLYHNTAVIFNERGEMAGKYRKMHIPDDPRYYEKFFFTPGDAEPGFFATATAAAKIGTLICWDRRANSFLSDRDWLAQRRRQRHPDRPSRCMGTDPAQPRAQQRLLRLRGEPRRY